MDATISRRALARLAVTGVAAAPSQTQAQSGRTDDELASARRLLAMAAAELKQAKLPPATEPAFHFNP